VPGAAPGELSGVHSSLDFVHWYNGHPTAHDAALLARAPWRRVDLSSTRNVAVIGAGNVALDVARLILRAPTALDPSSPSTSSGAKGLAALRTSDIPEPVLEHLSRARVEHVGIFARRGAAQLACTTKELREMLTLPGSRFRAVAEQDLAVAREDLKALEAAAASDPERATEARVRKRMLALLEKHSKEAMPVEQGTPSWGFNFFHRPQELRPASSDAARVGSARWQVGKSETSETPADTVVSSVGYLGAPLAGSELASDAAMPWDASRGVVPNEGGRVRGVSRPDLARSVAS
jgi:adrenodoxin-NADP+ reductase